jgi:hypothetical protein
LKLKQAPRWLRKLAVVSGDKQVATPGVQLPGAIVIRAADVNSLPYPGLRIQAAVSSGGSVEPQTATTDEMGLASFRWKPGPGPVNELQASVAGAAVTVTALGKPVVADRGVVNAASYVPGISPGSFATIFGGVCAGACRP